MKVVDIANEIYLENAEPEDTSIPAIAYWIRSNVGRLNNMIYENFAVDPASLEILRGDNTEISTLAAAIVKSMYKIYRIELDIRGTLSYINTDSVLEAKDQEFAVKKINRSEILKTLTAFKKDSMKELVDLIHNYRSYNGAPSQVTGDDTEIGHYVGLTSQYTRYAVGGV